MIILYLNHAFFIIGRTFSYLAQSYFYLFWKYELSSEVNSQETGFLHPNRSYMHGSICGHNSNTSETHLLTVRHQMPENAHKT